ncbi:MAG: hypothetical protein FWF80_02115 [Defluviitaleaceae bacterium]|nr:hypothetical protein [Defluviitaleaceae bacterium]
MDVNMKKATSEFVTERVNHHGRNETKVVNSAFVGLCDCAERLKASLTAEQISLFTKMENAYRLADGESIRFYWKSGFADALQFLMGWSSNGNADNGE